MRRIHLRTARERKGLTQVQLAQLAHVDQKTISRLELDPDADPAFSTQTNIAAALKVNPAALVFGPDPRQEHVTS